MMPEDIEDSCIRHTYRGKMGLSAKSQKEL
jgi:hypothetical protein